MGRPKKKLYADRTKSSKMEVPLKPDLNRKKNKHMTRTIFFFKIGHSIKRCKIIRAFPGLTLLAFITADAYAHICFLDHVDIVCPVTDGKSDGRGGDFLFDQTDQLCLLLWRDTTSDNSRRCFHNLKEDDLEAWVTEDIHQGGTLHNKSEIGDVRVCPRQPSVGVSRRLLKYIIWLWPLHSLGFAHHCLSRRLGEANMNRVGLDSVGKCLSITSHADATSWARRVA
ncbi:hypothetical protein Naga_100002g82 [Nannochloropsis gaditana]|uniref:Uncharacterized protein n=1 Tax=Nannochloropsis gaditana TaxID=72520 RepID=W7TYY2_9STRA|nr:hypothetical protein Naga_100002g82 [Nannochloropsis gaditana]